MDLVLLQRYLSNSDPTHKSILSLVKKGLIEYEIGENNEPIFFLTEKGTMVATRLTGES